MSVAISQAQKQRYRITLDLEVMDDFDPHQIHWEDLFELEGSESCLLYTSPSPRDVEESRMPSSA